MKIGFSFGRCVRDIVNDVVNYNDVLLIYASTHVENENQIAQMIYSYMNHPNYLLGLDYDKCIEVAKMLYGDGKVHQPRAFGMAVQHIPEAGVWMDLAPTLTGDAAHSELVQKAWKDYQMALKLSSAEVLPEDQFKGRNHTPDEAAEVRNAANLLAGHI